MLHRIIAIALMALSSHAAVAAIVVTATGQVSAVDADGGIIGSEFDGPVEPGMPVTLTLSVYLESFTNDLNPAPGMFEYRRGLSASLLVGNSLISSDAHSAADDSLSVQYPGSTSSRADYDFHLITRSISDPFAYSGLTVHFDFEPADPAHFDPLRDWQSPAAFQNFRLYYSAVHGTAEAGDYWLADFTAPLALTPGAAPVPVPAAAWLLLSAMGGFAAIRRRRAS